MTRPLVGMRVLLRVLTSLPVVIEAEYELYNNMI